MENETPFVNMKASILMALFHTCAESSKKSIVVYEKWKYFYEVTFGPSPACNDCWRRVDEQLLRPLREIRDTLVTEAIIDSVDASARQPTTDLLSSTTIVSCVSFLLLMKSCLVACLHTGAASTFMLKVLGDALGGELQDHPLAVPSPPAAELCLQLSPVVASLLESRSLAERQSFLDSVLLGCDDAHKVEKGAIAPFNNDLSTALAALQEHFDSLHAEHVFDAVKKNVNATQGIKGSWSVESFSCTAQLRRSHCSAAPLALAWGSWVLVSGGVEGELSHSPLVALNCSTGGVFPIRTSHPLPASLAQHTMTTFDGCKFYLIGNFAAVRWAVLVLDLTCIKECRNEASIGEVVCQVARMPLKFQHCIELPSKFHCHSAVPFVRNSHRMIAVFGGTSSGAVAGDLFELNLDTHVWSQRTAEMKVLQPAPRLLHSACFVQPSPQSTGHLYICYGSSVAQPKPGEVFLLRDIWRIALTDAEGSDKTISSSWEKVATTGDVPSGRIGASMHYIAPYIYLFGGFDGRKCLSDGYRLDPHSLVWQRLDLPIIAAPDPRPCWGGGSCVVSGNGKKWIVMAGGYADVVDDASKRSYSLTGAAQRVVVEPDTLKSILARFVARSSISLEGHQRVKQSQHIDAQSLALREHHSELIKKKASELFARLSVQNHAEEMRALGRRQAAALRSVS